MEGFLTINKPDGITSAEVVRVVKRALNTGKTGYLGTLDPIAKGALTLAIGRATRLIPFLEKQDKVYDAVMTLGMATDTQDRTGAKINEADPSAVTEEQVREVMLNYTGEIDQVPPMYSAKKINGKRLYDLARQGLEVERQPVRTIVHEMRFIEKKGPNVHFTARVGTGTYLRTLCHDMGAQLGVYGHLSELTRLRSGSFTLEESIALDRVTQENIDEVRNHLLSLSEGLRVLSTVVVISPAVDRLKNGQPIGISDIVKHEAGENPEYIRIISKTGELLGVGRPEGAPLAGFPFATIEPKRVMI